MNIQPGDTVVWHDPNESSGKMLMVAVRDGDCVVCIWQSESKQLFHGVFRQGDLAIWRRGSPVLGYSKFEGCCASRRLPP